MPIITLSFFKRNPPHKDYLSEAPFAMGEKVITTVSCSASILEGKKPEIHYEIVHQT